MLTVQAVAVVAADETFLPKKLEKFEAVGDSFFLTLLFWFFAQLILLLAPSTKGVFFSKWFILLALL